MSRFVFRSIRLRRAGVTPERCRNCGSACGKDFDGPDLIAKFGPASQASAPRRSSPKEPGRIDLRARELPRRHPGVGAGADRDLPGSRFRCRFRCQFCRIRAAARLPGGVAEADTTGLGHTVDWHRNASSSAPALIRHRPPARRVGAGASTSSVTGDAARSG